MTAVAQPARTGLRSAGRPAQTVMPTLPAALRVADEPDPPRASVASRIVAARYRLVEPLGAGGTGTVWLAHDRILGRNVALKHLGASGASGAARALHEARAIARVAHPNIVSVHDVVVDRNEHAWIVMEALAGVTLGARVAREGGLPVASVHSIAEVLVEAVDTLHSGGVIHRDIKPSNIHLGLDGRVVLTDFGVAARLGRPRAENDLLTGTLGYIAPEIIVGGTYSASSDLYALGAALWYASQGALPFAIRTVEDLIEHASAGADPPAVPRAEWLEPMITGLLQSHPADRWTATRARTFLREHRPGRATRRPTYVRRYAAREHPDAIASAHGKAGGRGWGARPLLEGEQTMTYGDDSPYEDYIDAELLTPEESLDDDETDLDPDEGYSPPERPLELAEFGTTAVEGSEHEDLSHRLARELPDVSDDDLGDGIGDTSDTDGEPIDREVGDLRAGRLLGDLLDPTDGASDFRAHDVGIAGAGASAEEAAIHVVPDEE